MMSKIESVVTLFIAFETESHAYDGHFIDADDSKIFTKREWAEAYVEERNTDRKEEVREWLNKKTEMELLKYFKRQNVNTMDEFLKYYPGETWGVKELELVK